MKLREFEGKQILNDCRLKIPKGVIVNCNDVKTVSLTPLKDGAVIKAQTFSGKRKIAGGVKFAETIEDMREIAEDMLNSQINNEIVNEVLLEERIDIVKEFYISITLDTKIRRPIIIFGSKGGSDIEEIKIKDPKSISYFEINVLEGITNGVKDKIFLKTNLSEIYKKELCEVLDCLYNAFCKYEMKLVEINPLALTNSGFFILDCKADIDDNALPRLNLKFDRTTGYRKKTDREKRANLIDETDHKGLAGKTFIDLDGDIGVLASGGGASIIAMDALIEYGAKPANYTEYSGNPPAYKVDKLTRIVLEKENQSGLWVVGGVANFTDIYETLKAIIDVAIELKINYPILIRRGGPNEKKAFEMIKQVAKENNLNVFLYGRETPITLSAKYMVELSNKYKKGEALEVTEVNK